ncbi:MAG: serine--tRNA ligase [Candidatus Portnoybacteria bacterium]|nr:serine--tRNA ligase [Candidatus Portnoybacteria bacterium]
MLDIKFIRENKQAVEENARKRGMVVDVGKLLALDEDRRKLIGEIEPMRAQQNKVSEEIAKEKDAQARQAKIDEMKKVKERTGALGSKLAEVEKEFNSLMLILPNMMQLDTPLGKSEADNKVLREAGRKPKFDFKLRDYMEIAKELDIIDTEKAAKVAGSRFGYLKNEAAILEFALVKLAIDVLSKESFKLVIPPVFLKPESLQAMGYIDTEEEKEERYFFEKDKLYLVGTSEQSIGPMHAGEILDEKSLPLRYAGFSTCFRREAGSYGKDTKGILRVHQFDKVEMFSFCRPEDSVKEHKLILGMEEKLMQELELPYRVVQLCSADIARPSSATFDIETWLPGQNDGQGQYRETHSCSNCTDWQARRMNIRYRNSRTGKTELAHTLNGTAFAVGRLIIAILENGQQENGRVKIPKVLRKFCGFKYIEKKK